MGRRALCDVCVRLIILRILLISLFLGGTVYVGDPGDSLEKCLYIDFSSTVVLIAPYRTKGLSQMIDSIASTHFLGDVAIADDGDDPNDNMEIRLKVIPS